MSITKLIDPLSAESVTKRIKFFKPKPTDVSHEKYKWAAYQPLNPVSDPPWLYKLPSISSYADFTNMYMEIQMRVSKRAAGSTVYEHIAPTDPISFIQMPGNCLQTVIITSGGREIYNCNAQALKTYIDAMMSFPDEVKNSHYEITGYREDDRDQVQAYALGRGFNRRRQLITNGKIAEFITKIDADILNIEDYFINNTEIEISATPLSAAFLLLCPGLGPNIEVRLEFLKARLFVPYQDLMPALNLDITRMLENGENVYYSILKSHIQTLYIGEGMDEVNGTIFINQLPRKIIVGLVLRNDMNGDVRTSPYAFQPFNIQSIRIDCNGIQYPNIEYDLNFSENRFARAYFDMQQNCGNAFRPFTNGITLEMYKKEYTFFAFNLSASLEDHKNHELIRNGATMIHVKLRTPVGVGTGGVNVVIYGMFDSLVKIDRNRTITTDASP